MNERERVRLAIKKANEWFLCITLLIDVLLIGFVDVSDAAFTWACVCSVITIASLRIWWKMADPDERRDN